MTKDLSILSGKWYWLWQVSDFKGGIQEVITLAKSMGYRGIIVKFADGNNEWTQFQQCYQPIKDAGLDVAGWIFNYGDDPVGEAKAVIDAFNLGAAYVCLDVENQFADKKDSAIKLGQLIRAAKPDSILTFAPWCMIDAGIWSHVPYAEIAQYCDAIQPQNYWSDYPPKCDEGLRQSDGELKKLSLPIYPIGQVYPGDNYTPTADDYDLFEKTCQELGYQGVSFWRAGTENDVMKQKVAAMNFPIVQSVQTPTSPQTQVTLDKDAAQRFLDVLHYMWHISDDKVQIVIEYAGNEVRNAAGIPNNS